MMDQRLATEVRAAFESTHVASPGLENRVLSAIPWDGPAAKEPSAPRFAGGLAAAIAVLIVVVLTTSLFLAGLPKGLTSPRASTYRIAAAPTRGDVILRARAEGVLRGQPNADGTACFWLGDSTTGEALSWPYGFTAGGKPLTVYNDLGKPVASVGQYVVFGGGLMSDSVHSILGCNGFATFWVVGEVVAAKSRTNTPTQAPIFNQNGPEPSSQRAGPP
jgi:hypothetical protein